MDIAHPPIHPGEILLEEYLKPLGVSQYQLAKTIGAPATRVSEIVRGRRGISAGTALRLSRALGTSDEFWVNLQAHYDLEVARSEQETELGQIQPLVRA